MKPKRGLQPQKTSVEARASRLIADLRRLTMEPADRPPWTHDDEEWWQDEMAEIAIRHRAPDWRYPRRIARADQIRREHADHAARKERRSPQKC